MKESNQPFNDELSGKDSYELNIGKKVYIIDSIPLSIARYARRN